MKGSDVCFGQVLSIEEAVDHLHNKARGLYQEDTSEQKQTVEVAERSRHAARLDQFGCEEPCGTTVSRLDGALCGVNLTVNHLKVWQSPIAE